MLKDFLFPQQAEWAAALTKPPEDPPVRDHRHLPVLSMCSLCCKWLFSFSTSQPLPTQAHAFMPTLYTHTLSHTHNSHIRPQYFTKAFLETPRKSLQIKWLQVQLSSEAENDFNFNANYKEIAEL
jgi:hypothetical protein